MTLQEAKDIIAKKHGYLSWHSLNAYGAVIPLNLFDEVAELYADSKVKKFHKPLVSGSLPLSEDRFNNYEPSDAEKELANQIYRSGNDR